MGKFLKKPNLTTDVVALMDVSQSSLGVRTRAKTLALQKLEASRTTHTLSNEQDCESSYLQLRSRKLEKPSCCRKQNPSVNVRVLEESQSNCGFGSEEASFGDNNAEFDGRERGTRESTPCSFIRDSNDIITPGSSTRRTDRHASYRTAQRIMPSTQELEEFFALHAQEQQRFFTEKYNFDFVNEKPLKGRYEWVRVQP